MIRCLAATICACLIGVLHAASFRDDAGNTISLDSPARRVVTLAPNLTELTFAAGAGERIVGTVAYSDFPATALRIPRIGDDQGLDLERIAALKPDLILGWEFSAAGKALERIHALGLPVFNLEPRTLDDIPAAIERIGALLGTDAAAKREAANFRQRLAALRERYAQQPHVRVFYQVWAQPLMTVNGSQMISSVIELCGGENVFAKQGDLVPQLSTESVVTANPEVILTSRVDHDTRSGARAGSETPDLASWKRFRSIAAVRNEQLWTIPGDAISRAGPRILDGADAVCAALDAARSKR